MESPALAGRGADVPLEGAHEQEPGGPHDCAQATEVAGGSPG